MKSPSRGFFAKPSTPGDAANNPILNNPYEEPVAHYATNLSGELDYEFVMPGRRVFTPDIQSVPVRSGPQAEFSSVAEAVAEHGDHLVNVVRHEVKQWRLAAYPSTTRVTKELLHYWFLDPQRENRLFFAQREAIETAIWLNEIAERSNPGQYVLSRLAQAQHVNGDVAANLPRVAFKMATGTGKTVVMAALIAYHFCNRQEYRNDVRFADNFLAVAPGVTIRDRLGVLCVQRETATEGTGDYYSERLLVPHALRKNFASLNAHLAITNFHAFQPRALQGNKRSPFDGKIGDDGEKTEATEDYGQVIKRLLPGFRPGTRLLILNDEAHHCYLPKQGDARKAEGENTADENERAAVWFRGLVELARRFKVRAVYDLSAAPYYLTGSGYDPYSLFPWVVSDFGLTEAIESGLVKIPFLPTSDDTDKLKEPVLRNLYEHIRDDLPRAGKRTQRARAAEAGAVLKEAPPRLPETLQAALDQFYRHYDEDYNRRGQLSFEAPPVFIVVCNNTSVSKEVFKFMAGYEQPADTAEATPLVTTGRYELFSNYDRQTLRPHRKPPTLLIDSDALENSGQIDESFKRVFAPEIGQFKADYRVIHGSAAADNITDAEILREIVNTVGKRGRLGAHIRCVVSVSMLTEGWDANTVTHVVGIRAFGSQLLCKQVAGRALRRKSYVLAPYDPDSGERLTDQIATRRKRDAQRARQQPRILWKFPPEYAHIIGVPFRQFKGGNATPPPAQPTTRVHALEERAARCEITFPNLDGYRIEYPEGALKADFGEVADYEIRANEIPTNTVLQNAFAADKVKLSLDDLLALRDQPILFRITKDLIRDHFSAEPTAPAFHRFSELHAIVEEWYRTKVRVLGKGPRVEKTPLLLGPQETRRRRREGHLRRPARRAAGAGHPEFLQSLRFHPLRAGPHQQGVPCDAPQPRERRRARQRLGRPGRQGPRRSRRGETHRDVGEKLRPAASLPHPLRRRRWRVARLSARLHRSHVRSRRHTAPRHCRGHRGAPRQMAQGLDRGRALGASRQRPARHPRLRPLGFSRSGWRDQGRRSAQHSPPVARRPGRHQAPDPCRRDGPAPRT